MALYEKTTATTVDEDDLDRSLKLYYAKKTDGSVAARVTVTIPGAASFDGLLSDVLTAPADRSALAVLITKMARAVLGTQGMTVKP